ncbi:Uncharacterised protein [Candidatus Anstonella stagnisolia]|nr:Uncharacterised protein [Candidatus Anstonella stagnisolia]
MSFATAYALTVLIETAALLLLLPKEDRRLVVLAGILASSITLPILWFVLSPLIPHESLFVENLLLRIFLMLFFEVAAIAVEAFVFRNIFSQLKWKGAFEISFLANAASFLIGLFIL